MRVICYERTSGEVCVRECLTTEDYFEVLGEILNMSDARHIRVHNVKDTVKLTREGIAKRLRAAAELVDGFGGEGSIIRQAMVEKALQSVKKLALLTKAKKEAAESACVLFSGKKSKKLK